QERDGLAGDLGRGVAEHLLGAVVPARYRAVETLADDGIGGILDDGGEPPHFGFGAGPLGDRRGDAEADEAKDTEEDLHREKAGQSRFALAADQFRSAHAEENAERKERGKRRAARTKTHGRPGPEDQT